MSYWPVTNEMLADVADVPLMGWLQERMREQLHRMLYPWEFPDNPVAWNVGPLLPRPLEWLAARIDRAA